MKLAATFEKLIAERRKEEKYRDVSVADILGELVKDYNSYKANAALKRWQLTPDQQSAISGVINGMSAEARQLVRQRLDFNKYDESGYCVFDCVIFLFVFHISGIKCCDPDAPCWCPNNTLN